MTTLDKLSQCCDAYITEYDRGNGEKYDACYECMKEVNPDGSLKE